MPQTLYNIITPLHHCSHAMAMKFIAEETTAATNAHQHGLKGGKMAGGDGKKMAGCSPFGNTLWL